MEVIQLFTSMYYVTGGTTNEKWFRRKISLQYIEQPRKAWGFFHDWPSSLWMANIICKVELTERIGSWVFPFGTGTVCFKARGEARTQTGLLSKEKKKPKGKYPNEISISIICPNDKFLLGFTSRRNNVFFVFQVSK